MQSARTLDLLRLGPGDRVSLEAEVPSCEALAATIVGFANAAGGTLVIGATKRGKVVGVRDVRAATTTIARAAELISPQLLIEPYVAHVDGRDVVMVDVPRGADTPYATADGRIWVRTGKRLAIADAKQAAELAQRAINGATLVSLQGRTTGRLQAKTAATPAVDLEHIMLKLERLIMANAELARKLDDAGSWRARITDQFIGAVLGLGISWIVFYVLGIG